MNILLAILGVAIIVATSFLPEWGRKISGAVIVLSLIVLLIV